MKRIAPLLLRKRRTGFGSLPSLATRLVRDGRRGKAGSGQAAALRWSGRRCAPTALRCSVSWPRRRTHCAHFVRCVQTTATSQSLMRAARAATSPALLGAPQARCGLPKPRFADTAEVFAANTNTRELRGRCCPAGAHAMAVAAARRLHCAARSGVASPNSLRSLRSLRSDDRDESVDEARWRAPTPALRCSSPPKSPPPGSACRDALTCRRKERPQTTATGRKPTPDRPLRLIRRGSCAARCRN